MFLPLGFRPAAPSAPLTFCHDRRSGLAGVPQEILCRSFSSVGRLPVTWSRQHSQHTSVTLRVFRDLELVLVSVRQCSQPLKVTLPAPLKVHM